MEMRNFGDERREGHSIPSIHSLESSSEQERRYVRIKYMNNRISGSRIGSSLEKPKISPWRPSDLARWAEIFKALV